MLTCLVGRAGAGKTAKILARAQQLCQSGAPGCLIVPEQFTFSAEKLLMQSAPGQGLLGLRVLSPSRLAINLLSRLGGNLPRLTGAGSALAMAGAIEQNRDAMGFFKPGRDVGSLNSLLCDLCASLEQSEVGPAQLADAASTLPSPLREKTQDIAALFASYQGAAAGRYATAAQTQQALFSALYRLPELAAWEVLVDGFDVMTPLNLRLCAHLAKVCQNVTVTFVCGQGADEALFAPARETLTRLTIMAREMDVPVQVTWLEQESYANPTIAHLEKNLFAYPGVPYAGQAQGLGLFSAPTAEAECELVASLIVQTARERGICYGQMAVLCPENALRPHLLARQLEKRGVPVRLEVMRTVASHPATRHILGALQAALFGFGEGDELRAILKGGYFPVEKDAADRFCNLLVQRNIRGPRFAMPILENEPMEAIRAALVEPIQVLGRAFDKAATGEEYARALWAYAAPIVDALWREGEEQVAKAIVSVLDESAALLGEISPRAYLGALESALMASQYGKLPFEHDSVAISDTARFKGEDTRALFVMGANDSLLPKTQAPQSLFSDRERDKMGLYMGASGRHFCQVQNLGLYGSLAQAKESITFTFSQDEGAPSPLVEKLSTLFALPVDADAWHDPRVLLGDAASTKTYLPAHLSRDPALWRDVAAYYEQTDPAFAQSLRAARTPGEIDPLPAGESALFRPERVSVSRLESYARCPFSYYLHYGLRPERIERPEISPIDRGNFFHAVMEQFLKQRAIHKNLAVADVEPLMERICEELSTPFAHLHDPASRCTLFTLRQGAKKAARALFAQFADSAFVPTLSEVRFGEGGRFPAIELPTDYGVVTLEGRIDRLDVLKTPERAYARVIDYKSGAAQLSFADVCEGTSLQLLTYLGAVCEAGEYAPAGAYYVHLLAKPKKLDTDDDPDEAALADAFLKNYRLEGISSAEDVVLQASALSGDLGRQINVTMTKAGVPRAGSPALPEQDLQTLLRYTKNKCRSLARDMGSGRIAPSPLAKKGGTSPCEFCTERAACPFDKTLGHKERTGGLSAQEALSIILSEDSHG